MQSVKNVHYTLKWKKSNLPDNGTTIINFASVFAAAWVLTSGFRAFLLPLLVFVCQPKQHKQSPTTSILSAHHYHNRQGNCSKNGSQRHEPRIIHNSKFIIRSYLFSNPKESLFLISVIRKISVIRGYLVLSFIIHIS